MLVIGASSIFGAQLEDSFDVPGLDSQKAVELLEETGSDQAGAGVRTKSTNPSGRIRSPFHAPSCR